jgi:peptide/nickel transport system substrate-binding protein
MKTIQELERLFDEGKLTRREFISRVSALGAAVTLSPVLFAHHAKAAVPKKGGRLRIGAPGGATADNLDPSMLLALIPFLCNQALRSNLVEIDADMKPIPELAESFEPSPDATRWVFKLRRDVEFHNGKTMTAEDVIESLNYHRGETKSAAKGIMVPVKDIKSDGKYTVIIDLNEGNADFPFIISEYHLTIFPTGTKGKDFDLGIGTGPFKLKEFNPGVRFFAERNPNYFREGRPYFDEYELLTINDLNSRTNALKSGQVDFISRCDTKTFKLLKRLPGIVAADIESARHFTFPMLTTIKPYDNNDARLGLKYLFDRDQLISHILMGYGYAGNDHPIARTNRYYAKEIPIRAYDPEKAKFHLKKAGLQNHTFKLFAAEVAFQGAMDAAVLIKEQAAKAGVKIDVVREPDDGYWSNVWMKKGWCMSYWSGRPTEDWMFTSVYSAEANWNEALWKHPHFNELLIKARQELDGAKRREMYVEMQRIVRDEGASVIPMFANYLEAYSDKLDHGTVSSLWELDGYRLAERWWFKS